MNVLSNQTNVVEDLLLMTKILTLKVVAFFLYNWSRKYLLKRSVRFELNEHYYQILFRLFFAVIFIDSIQILDQ